MKCMLDAPVTLAGLALPGAMPACNRTVTTSRCAGASDRVDECQGQGAHGQRATVPRASGAVRGCPFRGQDRMCVGRARVPLRRQRRLVLSGRALRDARRARRGLDSPNGGPLNLSVREAVRVCALVPERTGETFTRQAQPDARQPGGEALERREEPA